MTPVLDARSHPAGGRIDLRWSHDRPTGTVSGPPSLRLVRRRIGPPVHRDDGITVADIPELFASPSQPWRRLERLRCRTTNTAVPEGTLEAEVTFFHLGPPPAQPALLRLRLFQPATQTTIEEAVTECSRVVRTAAATPEWRQREVLEVFRTPGGGPEQAAGRIEIFTGSLDPGIADRLVWTPAVGTSRSVEFDALDRFKVDRTEASDLTFETRVLDDEPGTPWLTVVVTGNPDAGTETWSFTARDGGLEPAVDYYFGLFDASLPAPLVGQAVALATRDYDSPRRLFLRLPGAYQRADEPDPSRPTGQDGPLRRFLTPIGHTLDMARTTAEGLADRHDAYGVRADLLPALSRTIGWAPDLTATADTQRHDVLFAPQIFDTVGTASNVRALVNRVTSWPCRVKEFVHNVFLTNAPETIDLWELWQAANDGTSWSAPAPVTLTAGVDARPTVAVDGAGVSWLFWHSDRSGRRELWRQRQDGVDPAPALARAGAPDDLPGVTASEEEPAAVWDGSQVWVVWSSNREGQWDLWARTFGASPPGSAAIRLTDHPADDRSPAAVVVPGTPSRLWLFWSSSRRGPSDIWSRTLDLSNGVWTEPERLTTASLQDERPAAAVDAAGRIWLFWAREAGGRQTLWHQVHTGATWGPPQPLDVGHARDESPAAVPWKGGLLLLWHSNHGGPWQLWARHHDGTTWGPAASLNPDLVGDKEPAAVVDAAGDLRVYWRSQRRGRRRRSRTVDVNDTALLDAMGTFDDYAHYTYDAGPTEDDWYARGTVGVYLTPDTTVPSQIQAQVDRLRRFVEPFRPMPVRFVWLPESPVHLDVVRPQAGDQDDWSDETS